MELSLEMKGLVERVSREQEKIREYFVSLEKDGVLDSSLEEFLKDADEELQERKDKLIKEFEKGGNCAPGFSRCSAFRKFYKNEGRIMKKPLEEPISIVKDRSNSMKNEQQKIFSKKTSPERGNSPSARRYSPLCIDIAEKVGIKNHSPICSTRSSGSSEEKLLAELPEKTEGSLKIRYEEQREIRNKAQEKMLLIKEQILINKQIKLDEIIQKTLRSQEKKSAAPIKPPKSPQACSKSIRFETSDKIVTTT